MPSSELRILLVSDTGGDDDEGMKKIARMVSLELNLLPDVFSQIAPPGEVLKLAGSFDVLHYIGGPTYKSVLLSWLAKTKNRKLRTILTFSNPFWGVRANLLVRLIPPDHAIVVSSFWKNWAKDAGLPVTMFSVAGADTTRFVPVDDSTRTKLRNKLALPADKFIALHVGHLKTDRNLTALLRIQEDHEFQVVIVGSTTTTQSTDILENLSNAGCIVISTYQKNIEEYYQASDCYVFPTTDRKAAVQIPLSVLEALAAGIPVASTPFGGLPDMFDESDRVYYYEPDELGSADLMGTIRKAMKFSDSEITLGNKYSWQAIAKKLEQIYLEICQ